MLLRAITPSELESWAALCGSVFGEDENSKGEYFYNHFVDDPDADYAGVFVAEDEGRLVSSVRVFRRGVYIDGNTVGMGGIGEVCTRPDYRGKGLSTALLKMAVGYMKETGLAVSYLFTGKNQHYAHVGWFTVPRRYIKADIASLSPALGGVSCVRGLELKSEKELPISDTARFYAENAKKYNGPVIRSEEYYRRWISKCEGERRALLKDGKIAACALYYINDNDRISLSEYTGGLEFLPVLIALAARESGAKNIRMPETFAPSLYGANNGENFDFGETTGLMARLNIPFEAGGKKINTAAELCSALSGCAFFDSDGF